MVSDFENLLKLSMGLDAASIGSSAIERAVHERQAACRLKDVQAYWKHVSSSETELQELIEAVVVPETWFFRDREAFSAMVRMAQEQWLQPQPERVLRLLSVPCSTGEEPYSMAMALLDGGVAGPRFHIHALDISERALAQARRAIYGRNSFRGHPQDFRERYFEPAPHGQHLRDEVRAQVTFQQGNLFDPAFLPGASLYDVVFCRNVLIYFDRPTQDRALAVLLRLLAADGLLFVAPSETGLLLAHGFVSAKVPLAFAFRRATAPAPAESPAVLPLRRPPVAPGVRASVRPQPAPVRKPAPPAARGEDAPAQGIEQALRLADAGRLDEAAQACEAYLQRHVATAPALYLMGLVRDASGRFAEAANYYRKALYLDPGHNEALLHLALLLDQGGDAAGAQVLRARARRLERAGNRA